MLADDTEVATEEIEILGEAREDDEVWQTKIISPQEVSRRWSEWIEAVDAEASSLLEEKETMEEVSSKKLEEILKGAEQMGATVEFLPTKEPGKRGGKPKVCWVICGNFEQIKDGESTYSSGTDAAALKLLLVTSHRMQWTAGTDNVKTAFLDAVMDQRGQQTLILVKPPPLFIEKGYMKLGTYYLPQKAVYGLRRSPKLWGECGDNGLETMEVEIEESPDQKLKLELTPLESEPNLWKIQQKEEKEKRMKVLLRYHFERSSDDLRRRYPGEWKLHGGSRSDGKDKKRLDHVGARSSHRGSHQVPGSGDLEGLQPGERPRHLVHESRLIHKGSPVSE